MTNQRDVRACQTEMKKTVANLGFPSQRNFLLSYCLNSASE